MGSYAVHRAEQAELHAGRLQRELSEARAEATRLQEAKRRALAIADERSKENVGLRTDNERLLAALQDLADYQDPLIESTAYVMRGKARRALGIDEQ